MNAFIGLGSNVGDRQNYLCSAIAELKQVGEVVAVSSVYETAPVGFTDQPAFLNMVVEIRTELAPEVLMQDLLRIERALGRDRNASVPQGPRTLDLDLLFAEDNGEAIVCDLATLTLPHPRLAARRFVLKPLAEIAPNLHHPQAKKTMEQLLEDLVSEGPNAKDAVVNRGTLS